MSNVAFVTQLGDQSKDGQKNVLICSATDWTILSTDYDAAQQFVGTRLWDAFPHWEPRTRKYWEYARDHGHCSIVVYDDRRDQIYYARLYRSGHLLKCEAEAWEPQRVMLLRDSLGIVLDDLVRRLAGGRAEGSAAPADESDDRRLRLVDG